MTNWCMMLYYLRCRSLVSVATLEKETNTIILKVVNTTQHEEKTELNIKGASVKNDAESFN